MTHETVTQISQIAALIFFVALFIGVLVYVFWPGNKKKFEDAARLPIESNDKPEDGDRS